MNLSPLVAAGLILAGLQHQAAQTPPAKTASAARFDLQADGAAGSLMDGVLSGEGSVERMNWVSEPERERGFTVNFPITRFGWRECSLRFVPARAGEVSLRLMGPWEEAAPGVLYQQEVFWDGLQVSGATVTDDGWNKLPRPVKSWHNAPSAIRLKVASRRPVTLQIKARASVPPGFQEMRRISSRDTPAHRAASRFRRGANLGNYLEVPPGQNWGADYSAADFVHLKAEGFDHVRLPIAWHHYAGSGPEFKLSESIFAKVDFLVTNALANGLNALVNLHHFDEFTRDPVAQTGKFKAMWRQIAGHYANQSDAVAFELLNEPKDAATTLVINPIFAETIRVIRETNPGRTIFIGPGKWNQVSELSNLRLPDGDQNLVVTIHCYDPFFFTHQGASWTGTQTRTRGIRYPGPPETPLTPDPEAAKNSGVTDWIRRYNTLPTEKNPSSPSAFRNPLRQARDWSDYYGRPVHVGEFGCYIGADPVSRARFHADFRQALDEFGVGWAVWDWKAGFRYWDERANAPAPGMREALFPGRK